MSISSTGDSTTVTGVTIGDSLTAHRVYTDQAIIQCCNPVIHEEGAGGNTLPIINARFTDATDYNPDFIVIQGGTNDTQAADPNASMQAAVEAMVGKTLAASATPVLVKVCPLGVSSYNVTRQGYIDTHNTWLVSYCSTNGYELADTDDPLRDGVTNKLADDYDSGDGIHLSTSGYVKMGKLVAAAIQSAGTW